MCIVMYHIKCIASYIRISIVNIFHGSVGCLHGNVHMIKPLLIGPNGVGSQVAGTGQASKQIKPVCQQTVMKCQKKYQCYVIAVVFFVLL